jgi:hypothetical protein
MSETIAKGKVAGIIQIHLSRFYNEVPSNEDFF